MLSSLELKMFFKLLKLVIVITCLCATSIYGQNYSRANFGKVYEGSVDLDSPASYIFNYTEIKNQVRVMTVHLSSTNANQVYPLYAMMMRENQMETWQVPYLVEKKYEFERTSRMLCPLEERFKMETENDLMGIFHLTTLSKDPVNYKMEIEVEEDKIVDIDTKYTVSIETGHPALEYYAAKLPDDVKEVKIRVISESDECMVISLQDTICPMDYQYDEMSPDGMHLSATKSATIHLQDDNSLVSNRSFFIAFKLLPTDDICNGETTENADTSKKENRFKNVTFWMEEAPIEGVSYVKAMLLSVGLYTAILLLITVFVKLNQDRLKKKIRAHMEGLGDCGEESCLSPEYGTINDGSIIDADTVDSEGCTADIFGSKALMYVHDQITDVHQTEYNFKLFGWNLIPISIFYLVPAFQIVVAYLRVYRSTGKQDTCYYNFRCSNPLGYLGAFNAVFSNFGYIESGFFLLLFIHLRQNMNRKLAKEYHRVTEYGIQQPTGVLYAGAYALIIEGFMSGCYHVCPSAQNFQFDMSFMYIITALVWIKMFQQRTCELDRKSHFLYLVMAFIVCQVVIGQLAGTTVFWFLFLTSYVIFIIFYNFEFYYHGKFKIANACEWIKTFWGKPIHMSRAVYLIVFNMLNIALLVYSSSTLPGSYAVFVLAIFILNAVVYLAYYLIMKLVRKEKWKPLLLFNVFLVSGLWIASVYFFIQNPAEWADTPAHSRTRNQDCIVMDFFDVHDVWHILGSLALLVSFSVVITLDDDLITTPKSKISVF